MSLPPSVRSQPEATLLGPGGLLSRVFKQMSENEQHNIIQNAWLAILRGQGDNWSWEIRGEGCVHKVNLCQLADHVNTWAFEFNTETND